MKKPLKIKCHYCQGDAKFVGGQDIYPHRPDLWGKKFYLCKPCDAYVGCHPNSVNPLGILANAKLRAMKSSAHAAFDPMWRNGDMTRSAAYSWLASTLEIEKDQCHIGMFNEFTCMRVIIASNSWRREFLCQERN